MLQTCWSARHADALRQDHREGAATAHFALQLDLAAKQSHDLAADREAQARTAVLTAGRAIRLRGCLTDQLLLVDGDTDTGIDHFERDHACGGVKLLMALRPAKGGRRD